MKKKIHRRTMCKKISRARAIFLYYERNYYYRSIDLYLSKEYSDAWKKISELDINDIQLNQDEDKDEDEKSRR